MASTDRASPLPLPKQTDTNSSDGFVIKSLRWIKERVTNRYPSGSIALAEADQARIELMVATVSSGRDVAQPSLYWRKLIRLNIDQLYYAGYENFKRTLALNYFTFVNILPWDPQIRILLKLIPKTRIVRIAASALGAKSAQFYSSVKWIQTRIYFFVTLAMHERLISMKLESRLLALEEPAEGGAIPVRSGNGAYISADLCNSMLEYHVVSTGIPSRPNVVMELGGGYGRTAFVWLSLNRCKYIMVDIAPALWVAERYLSSIFHDRRLFRWRPISNFADVRQEFDEAEVCFLTPDQLEYLPERSVDLGINISSFHEMTIDKIGYFISQFDRLLAPDGHFYLKAWKRSVLPVDNVVINRADYPIPADWASTVERTPDFQPTFFEAIFRKKIMTKDSELASGQTL
jgi:putative sugar O-methyltransferase